MFRGYWGVKVHLSVVAEVVYSVARGEISTGVCLCVGGTNSCTLYVAHTTILYSSEWCHCQSVQVPSCSKSTV